MSPQLRDDPVPQPTGTDCRLHQRWNGIQTLNIFNQVDITAYLSLWLNSAKSNVHIVTMSHVTLTWEWVGVQERVTWHRFEKMSLLILWSSVSLEKLNILVIDDTFDRQSKYYLYRRQGSRTLRASLQDSGRAESGTDGAAQLTPLVSRFPLLLIPCKSVLWSMKGLSAAGGLSKVNWSRGL